MERLTRWNDRTEMAELEDWDTEEEWKDFIGSLDVPEQIGLGTAIDKLAEYEDAEEQGLLIKFPCREVFESSGDVVYYIFDYEIVEGINCGVSLDAEGVLWMCFACDEHIFPYRDPIAGIDTDPSDWCQASTYIPVIEWSETVFLTREEAEQALRERESE